MGRRAATERAATAYSALMHMFVKTSGRRSGAVSRIFREASPIAILLWVRASSIACSTSPARWTTSTPAHGRPRASSTCQPLAYASGANRTLELHYMKQHEDVAVHCLHDSRVRSRARPPSALTTKSDNSSTRSRQNSEASREPVAVGAAGKFLIDARARIRRQVGSRAPCASTARRRPAERRGAPNAFQEAWKAEAGPLDEDAVAAMAKRYGL